MNIREYAQKFCVFVVSNDVDLGASIKVALSQAGYESYFFQDQDSLKERIKQNPPHIVIFTTKGMLTPVSDFVQSIITANSEIKLIVLAELVQFETLAKYNDHGIADVVLNDKLGLEDRITWSVDRTCERIYLNYQNEQLYEELKKEKSKKPEVVQVEQSKETAQLNMAVSTLIADYKTATSKEELIQKFMLIVGPQMPCVYFKYLPSVHSLTVTTTSFVDPAKVQGITCQLDPQNKKNFISEFAMGLVPPKVSETLSEQFNLDAKIMPLFFSNYFEGILAYAANVEEKQLMNLYENFALFSVCYANFSYEKRIDQLEILDPVTEVYNRKFYILKCEEEWKRAQRAQLPLSIVKVAFDDFVEIEKTLGENTRNHLLRSLAALIHKSSRLNDFTCRTGLNEITMILPNCTRKGASLRAERVRRLVETTHLIDNGVKVSVSLGISEYPTLSDSAETLDNTATRALTFIQTKGGNKLCLYKAPDTHKPAYQVVLEEG